MAKQTSEEKPLAAGADEKPVLRITAKPKKGFRRCGVHHPAVATDHPDGRFSESEIAVLKAEAMLVVEDL